MKLFQNIHRNTFEILKWSLPTNNWYESSERLARSPPSSESDVHSSSLSNGKNMNHLPSEDWFCGERTSISYTIDTLAPRDQRWFLQRNGNYSPFCFLLATRAEACDNRVGPETCKTLHTVTGRVGKDISWRILINDSVNCLKLKLSKNFLDIYWQDVLWNFSIIAIQFAVGVRLACVPSRESIDCLHVCVTRLARNLTKHVTRWFNTCVLGQCLNGKMVYLAIIKINTLNKKLSKFCLDVMRSNALSIFLFVFIRSREHYRFFAKKQTIENS